MPPDIRSKVASVPLTRLPRLSNVSAAVGGVRRRRFPMFRKAVRFVAAALCVAAVVGSAYADHHEGKKDIIDTATGPGMQKVTTVVAAIKAAGLVEALKGEGPFTVFAPTNDAF